MPSEVPPTGAVFLSYASEDADAAARICESLRAAGVEVWFDRDELRGGDAWDSKIKRQIHDCALFLPVISAHTNARTEGYFRREWKLATRRLLDIADDAAFLVPVVIDDTREGQARVPEEFMSVQWTRLPGGETPPAFAQQVRTLLGADVPIEQAAVSRPLAHGLYSHNKRASRIRLVGFASIGVLIAAAAAYWIFQGAGSPRTSMQAPETVHSDPTEVAHEKSIAVLPFVNMSSDKEQEYFSDGLSEELLNLLSKIPELHVAARTSSFFFKGKDVKLMDVARELRVAHLLEGSVRKSGDRVRITAQLIRASDGYHQWSETYDRKLEDIFAVQDEIAAAVVSQLKVSLLGQPARAHETSAEAYGLFLQARQLDRRGEDRYEESIELYKRVIAIDPNYAPAWVWLGANYGSQVYAGTRPSEGVEEARQLMHKALALDPTYALPYAGLGWLAMNFDQDLGSAAKHLQRALALDPTNVDTWGVAGGLSTALGHADQAVEFAEYVVSRDPLDYSAHSSLGSSYFDVGRFDDSVQSLRVAVKLSPTSTGTYSLLGDALLYKGDQQAALDAYGKEPTEPLRLAGLVMAHHALGHTAQARALLAELIEKYGDWPNLIATVYGYQSDADRSFRWLEKAASTNDPGLTSLPASQYLRALHDDPRWLPFVRKLGKSPEQLAAIKFEPQLPPR